MYDAWNLNLFRFYPVIQITKIMRRTSVLACQVVVIWALDLMGKNFLKEKMINYERLMFCEHKKFKKPLNINDVWKLV